MCAPNQFGCTLNHKRSFAGAFFSFFFKTFLVVALGIRRVGVAFGGIAIALGSVASVLAASVLVAVVGGSGSAGRGRSRGRRGSVDSNRLDSGSLGGDGEAEQGLVVLDSGLLRRGAVHLVGSNGGGQVNLVLLDLVLHILQAGGGADLRSDVVLDVGVGLLDGEAATKGTSKGVVSAADSAHISSGS